MQETKTNNPITLLASVDLSLSNATLPEQDHSRLLAYVRRKEWWHVPPADPEAYQKRGKFYSSTYTEARFYGRPAEPERVQVTRPFVCDNDAMEEALFGERVSDTLSTLESGLPVIKARLALDARIKEATIARGYDCIVLMSPKGYTRYLSEGKIPRSIELNVFLPEPQEEKEAPP